VERNRLSAEGQPSDENLARARHCHGSSIAPDLDSVIALQSLCIEGRWKSTYAHQSIKKYLLRNHASLTELHFSIKDEKAVEMITDAVKRTRITSLVCQPPLRGGSEPLTRHISQLVHENHIEKLDVTFSGNGALKAIGKAMAGNHRLLTQSALLLLFSLFGCFPH
jgi:hypothetical protein